MTLSSATPLTDKLILGTAQLGMNYGINNSTGKPSRAEAFEILNMAFANGIHTLDTAEGYGEAHTVIGDFNQPAGRFNIITKFVAEAGFNAEEQLRKLLRDLHVQSLYCWMYHRFSEALLETGIESLLPLKENKLLKNIGVSIYTNNEFKQAIEMDWVDVIQIPFNLLDNFHIKGELLKKAKLNGKEVHARSVFLQGLFFMPLEQLPKKLEPLKPYLKTLLQLSNDSGISMSTMALHYAVKNDLIDKVLIGVDNAGQLQSNINLLRDEKMELSIMDAVNAIRVNETSLLSPVNWK